jgi:HNH endonuclease
MNQELDLKMNLVLNLSKIPDQELLSRLERLTKTERKITHLILWHILEVDTRKLYLKLNYDSLYKYLTQHLDYSESGAYDRMQAARLLKQIPEIATKIEDGSLNLTQLVKVEQSLKQEKKLGHDISKLQIKELIEKVENKNTFETEKIIACELNQTPKAYQKVKPQADESVRLEVTLTQEQYEHLKKAQSLMSHIVTDNNLADGITYLAQSFIQKKEGKAKTSQEILAQPQKEISPTQSFRAVPKRKHIAASVRRQIFAKADHCCEHMNPKTHKRCNSKHQLQIDHIKPLAKGGTDSIANLRLLCGVHNRLEALKWGLRRRP